MEMSKIPKAFSIAILFGALSASAATGFPQAHLEYMPRGANALDFVVTTFGTDHFGPMGGAVFFAMLGLFLIGVVGMPYRRMAGAGAGADLIDTHTRPVRKSSRRKVDIDSDPSPVAPRRRTISAQTVAAEFGSAFEPPILPPVAAQDVSGPRPAWGLMLASPWEHAHEFTSWLGGLPRAPEGFDWPRDAEDGEPMHFYAQLDLASLLPEPATGARPPGLPANGALLVFIGHAPAVRVIEAAEMVSAQLIAPPADLPSLRKFGYWDDGSVFPAWPVVPRAFLDEPYDEEDFGRGPPIVFSDPHREPADWINNWGMAELEAGTVITALQNDLRSAQGAFNYHLKKLAEDSDDADADNDRLHATAMEAVGGYYELLLTEAPPLIAGLEDWKARAEAHDPLEPVDRDALAELFERRRTFCSREERNFSGTIALRGAAYKVWEEIWGANRGDLPFVALRSMPEAYREFAEKRITGWRRHRLFGIEPPFGNNWEDLRGKDCLISIGADPLLRTTTEHEYGLSLWAPLEDLENGRYEHLELVRHCAV